MELLIVCAIIATLVGIAVPNYLGLLKNIKKEGTANTIEEISNKILVFEAENGRLPDTLAEAGIDLRDEWGNPYQYIPIRGKPTKGKDKVSPRKDKFLHPLNSDFDLWSMGPDGKTALPLTAKASRDDIIRAGDGSYLGVAEGY